MIGIADEYMRRLESEKANCGFSFETLYKISVALDVSINTRKGVNVKYAHKLSA